MNVAKVGAQIVITGLTDQTNDIEQNASLTQAIWNGDVCTIIDLYNNTEMGRASVENLKDPSVSEVLSAGTVSLDSGASGSVDGITINGVEVMGAAKATAVMATVTEAITAFGTVTCASALSNIYSFATITAATVLENTFATGTVTCATVLENTFADGTAQCTSVVANTFATNTAQCASVLADDTITVNGNIYTGVAGSKGVDYTKFSIDTGNDATATDLADSINNDVRVGTSGDVSAVAATHTVTLTTTVEGTAGNAITLAQSGATFTLGGATFSSGVDADTVTINGLLYTAVGGARGDDTQFSILTGDTACALDLAAAINADVRSGTSQDVSASPSTDTVTITTDVAGTGGNVVTMAQTGGTITLSGDFLTGGVSADTVTINGLLYTAVAGTGGAETFSTDGTDSACATDLLRAITAEVRTGTSGTITAVAPAAIVTVTTSVAGDTGGNAITLSSSDAVTLAVSGSGTLTGGVDADTVTVNGLPYTAVAGTGSTTTFSTDTDNDATATDLARAINADTRDGTTGDISALASTDTVTVTTDVLGTGGDIITLVSSDGGTLAVTGGGTLGGYTAASTVTVNGLVYTAKEGTKSDNTEFDITGTDTEAAADLAASIDADTRIGTLGDLYAENSSAVVTITSTIAFSAAGNAVTLVTSDGTTLSPTGSGTLTGGKVADTITVNGLVYGAVAGARPDNTKFSTLTSNDATATDLAAAITADTRTGTLNKVTATAATDTVTMVSGDLTSASAATTLAENTTASRITISAATFDSYEFFDTSLIQTATNVAANITAATSVPNYTAASGGTDTVTITTVNAAPDPDTFTVTSSSTTIGTTDGDMAGGTTSLGTVALAKAYLRPIIGS